MEQQIKEIFEAHRKYPTKPSKAHRKWDGKTPYGVHPTWCAMTLAHETNLPEEIRETGVLALLYHDIIEDTNYEPYLSAKVNELVIQMTFENGSKQEMKEIWSKDPVIRLLKLYDKVSNFMDGDWMAQEKKENYKNYIKQLIKDVETNYGKLNITKLAKGLVEN